LWAWGDDLLGTATTVNLENVSLGVGIA